METIPCMLLATLVECHSVHYLKNTNHDPHIVLAFYSKWSIYRLKELPNEKCLSSLFPA